MAFKQTILRANSFSNYGALHRKLRELKDALNTSQVDAIADGSLTCEVTEIFDVSLLIISAPSISALTVKT